MVALFTELEKTRKSKSGDEGITNSLRPMFILRYQFVGKSTGAKS